MHMIATGTVTTWKGTDATPTFTRRQGGVTLRCTSHCGRGEIDRLEPLPFLYEAVALYEQLPEMEVKFEEAFPTVDVEEA